MEPRSLSNLPEAKVDLVGEYLVETKAIVVSIAVTVDIGLESVQRTIVGAEVIVVLERHKIAITAENADTSLESVDHPLGDPSLVVQAATVVLAADPQGEEGIVTMIGNLVDLQGVADLQKATVLLQTDLPDEHDLRESSLHERALNLLADPLGEANPLQKFLKLALLNLMSQGVSLLLIAEALLLCIAALLVHLTDQTRIERSCSLDYPMCNSFLAMLEE